MPQQDGLEVSIVYPVQTFRGVGLLVVVIGEKAISLQPAGCIQDEDLEQGLAESEPGGTMALGQGSDEEIQGLHILRLSAIYALEFGHLPYIVGQLLEASDRPEPELTPELVVARHPTFPCAQNIDRPQIENGIARHAHLLHEAGEVVEH